MSNETDLDWLARNVHVWPTNTPKAILPGDATFKLGAVFYGDCVAFSGEIGPEYRRVNKADWLARREELQNKPSFADHPDAKCFVQIAGGGWYKNKSDVELVRSGSGATLTSLGVFELICRGDVLGDWRDTLEKRPCISATNCTVTSSGSFGVTVGEPAYLSEQAVTARLQEATDNVLSAVQDLNSDKYKFYPFTSIEGNQEQEMNQDNKWFDRGELPPVGVWCEASGDGASPEKCKIIAYHKGQVALQWEVFNGGCLDILELNGEYWKFSPIRTEREALIEIIAGNLSGTTGIVADAIIAAGFKLEAK